MGLNRNTYFRLCICHINVSAFTQTWPIANDIEPDFLNRSYFFNKAGRSWPFCTKTFYPCDV